MIEPSEINLSSLPWLPLDTKSAFPKNPAIYFAIDSQEVVQYIGRSVNPKRRWANHHKYKDLKAIGSIKIVYLFVDSPDLLPEIESALILWFDPPLNAMGRSANDSELPAATSKKMRIRQVKEIEIRGLGERIKQARLDSDNLTFRTSYYQSAT